MTDILEATLEYAARGWHVLPLRGKHPLLTHGFHDATTDADQIARWWQSWPTANVGIALPESVIVLDIDPRHGGSDMLAAHTAEHGPLPVTLTAISGRGDGGCHFYYRHPGGRLTGRRIGDGIDLREGSKSYVVGPPSVHPETGGRYRWANEAPIAWPPVWLVDLLRPVTPTPSRKPDVSDKAGRPDPNRADRLVMFVEQLLPGNRNEGLFWAACRAAEDGMIDALTPRLTDAALSIGLDPTEIDAVLRSARGRRAA